MTYIDIACPKCNKKFYSIDYTTSTAMWSPTIIKDGKVISSNPNYETYHCQCIACGTYFNVYTHNDNIESIEAIEGFAPVSELPYETIQINAAEADACVAENRKLWAKAAEESYQDKVSTIKQEIANLKSELSGNTKHMGNIQYPMDN